MKIRIRLSSARLATREEPDSEVEVKARVRTMFKKALEEAKEKAKDPNLVFPLEEEIEKAIEIVPDKFLKLIRDIEILHEYDPRGIGWAGWNNTIILGPEPRPVYEEDRKASPKRPGWDHEIWKCTFIHELGHIVYENLPEDDKQYWKDVVYPEVFLAGPALWDDPEECFADCFLGFLLKDKRIPLDAILFFEDLTETFNQ
ncbi:MAG TPA: hypothetical protein ENF26_04525 [Methanomicrobia archaeon]|nr:hypothetical protein [Methanomicrobia archaeon]HEX59395.1 hypothetical protein [Methanomicrobia archaeon]